MVFMETVEARRFLPTWFASSIALAFAALIMGSRMNIGDPGETTLNRVLALAVVGLVINAGLLLLTEWITSLFGVHFFVDGFWWAVLASLVISLFQSIVWAIISE